MEDVLARLERLERAVAVGAAGERAVAPAASVAADEEQLGLELFALLRERRRPGHVLAVAGVAGPGGVGAASALGDEPKVDAKRVAGVCGALASEARLAILRELAAGRRGTGELLAATGIDRGQLYHHLRDLFVQGLVEQPERGRYRLTGRGGMTFHIACLFPQFGGPREDAVGGAAALDLGEEDGALKG